MLAMGIVGNVRADSVVDRLQEISVTIASCGGEGSGVLVSRGDVTYVLTAAHVVESCRKTRQVIDGKGQVKSLVWFEPVNIVRQLIEGGRTVGKMEFSAEVMRYSDPTRGDDIALLRVRKKSFTKATAVFYQQEEMPPLGTELYHVGSFYGEENSSSLSTGIISQHGRMLFNKEFMLTSCTATAGSSGGGIFLKDGTYVSMLVRGHADTVNYSVPITRIRQWAKRCGVEFILNDAIKVPDNISKGDIEDSEGAASIDESSAGRALENYKSEPTLIRRTEQSTKPEEK
jgi:hypothetical protein